MATLPSMAPGPSRDGAESSIRAVVREGSGAIHLDWPVERIPDALADRQGLLWVDIEDLEASNNQRVEALLRDVFHFHPLAIEDALKDTHIPKVDDWGDYLYLVFHSIDFDPQSVRLRLHELDAFLGPNYLVT